MSKTNVADENSNMLKDPDDWKTGDEEMTGAQRSYLQTLADEAHSYFPVVTSHVCHRGNLRQSEREQSSLITGLTTAYA